MMQIGDVLRFRPEGLGSDVRMGDDLYSSVLLGRVVWIHPQGRFFLVEGDCFGHPLRTCFQLVRGVMPLSDRSLLV